MKEIVKDREVVSLTSGIALNIALELYSQHPQHLDYYFKALTCHANLASDANRLFKTFKTINVAISITS